MSKDLNCKWNFVVRNEASFGQDGESSDFKCFEEHPLRCLVRETIQNSLDAHNKECAIPVKVVFSEGSLLCEDYPELILSVIPRLEACNNARLDNSKDNFSSKLNYLKEHASSQIGYVKISDYNTLGMPYDNAKFAESPFKSCVRKSGSSYKMSETAAGSHGLGKIVGNVNSGYGAIYYSTMTLERKTYGEGNIRLRDHIFSDENGEEQLYENSAFYDSMSGLHPDSGDTIPEVFRRKEPGTDMFVIGIELDDADRLTMKKEVLRAFFRAFAENELIVDLFGEEFSEATVYDKMRVYFAEDGEFDKIKKRNIELVFNPRPYYEEVLKKVGTDEEHILFDSNVDFPGQFPLLDHAKLYVWKSPSIKQAGSYDRVVYMRENDMVIEVKNGRNNHGYYGVFVCYGGGSSTLRTLENVTHDKWIIATELRNKPKEVKRKAEETLNQKNLFINECERVMFPEEPGVDREIESLKKRKLSILGNREAENPESIWPSTNNTKDGNVAEGQKSVSSITELLEGRRPKKKVEGKKIAVESDLGKNQGGDNPGPGPTPGPSISPTTPLPTVEEGNGNTLGRSATELEKGKRQRVFHINGNDRYLIADKNNPTIQHLKIRSSTARNNCSMHLFVRGSVGLIPLKIKRVAGGLLISGDDKNVISGINLIIGINTIEFEPEETAMVYNVEINAFYEY